MKEDISTLYHNDFGMSFKWVDDLNNNDNNIRIIFRLACLYVSITQIKSLLCEVNSTLNKAETSYCNDCELNSSCKSLLMHIPNSDVSFAMSHIEMEQMKELLEGTLFQIELQNFLGRLDIT